MGNDGVKLPSGSLYAPSYWNVRELPLAIDPRRQTRYFRVVSSQMSLCETTLECINARLLS